MYDVIVIGAGPAGISSALYTKRAGLDVLVLYFGKSSLEKAEKIDNYYGFENGISGEELYRNGINQAKNIGVEVKYNEVLGISPSSNNGFVVTTSEAEYETKALILATGSKKLKPNIEGIDEYEGRGVSYCAVCDGFFYRNKKLAVIGSGEFAIHEATYLQNIASEVVICTNGFEMETETDLNVETRKIAKVSGENKVTKLILDDNTEMNIDGVFIALGQAGGSDFAKTIGILLDGDNIIVDKDMKTNVDGIYSCGDIVGNLLQVSKSVHDGAVAGLSVVNYIRNKENN